MGAKRDDNGKAPIDMIPYEALEQIALALKFGAEKYGTYNFTEGLKYSRMLGPAERHLKKRNWVSKNDEESGLNHLAHVGANIVMLLWHELKRPDLDDTYVKYKELKSDMENRAQLMDANTGRTEDSSQPSDDESNT